MNKGTMDGITGFKGVMGYRIHAVNTGSAAQVDFFVVVFAGIQAKSPPPFTNARDINQAGNRHFMTSHARTHTHTHTTLAGRKCCYIGCWVFVPGIKDGRRGCGTHTPPPSRGEHRGLVLSICLFVFHYKAERLDGRTDGRTGRMFVLKQAHAGRRVLSLVCQNGHVNHKKKILPAPSKASRPVTIPSRTVHGESRFCSRCMSSGRALPVNMVALLLFECLVYPSPSVIHHITPPSPSMQCFLHLPRELYIH